MESSKSATRFESVFGKYKLSGPDLVEDAGFLAKEKVPYDRAAKRLGFNKPDSLTRALYRQGAHDISAKLAENSASIGLTIAGTANVSMETNRENARWRL